MAEKNFFERAISTISPKWAADRQRYRLLNAYLEQQERRYNAAASGRRTDGWQAYGTSANGELSNALHKLRDRSRDLARNNPYARRAMKTIATNTVGSGIRPKVKAEGRILKRVSKEWEEWAETTECDFDGQHNIYGLQRLVMRSVAESGEAIVRKRRGGKYGIQLQVVEADFIDTSKTMQQLTDGGYIIQGVEFNANGKRVAYWMFDHHPGDSFTYNVTSSRIPVSEFAHIYFVERPGQVRGTPQGVSAMMRMYDLDEYEDAALMGKKVAACFAAFVTTTGDGMISGSKQQEKAERVEPGMIEYLAPGQTVTFGAPPSSDGYGEYTTAMLRSIAAGNDVTYEQLTGDYSNVNFSSARMAWIEFHRSVQEWQDQMMIPMFCQRTWAWFNDALIMNAIVSSPVPATWTTPRREMIDPVKEGAALNDAVRSGFISWAEAVRAQGYDPDALIAEISEYNKKLDENKIMLDSDGRIDAKAKLAKAQNAGGSPTNLEN